MPTDTESATQLIIRWREGDESALRVLIPLVYRDLRLAAHRCLRSERSDHTLQTTDLVHEAYLRLAGDRPLPTDSKAHFVALAAARLMRQILVDYARRRSAAKRGPQVKVELDASMVMPQRESIDIEELDRPLGLFVAPGPAAGTHCGVAFFWRADG